MVRKLGLAALVALVAACGSNRTERAVTGGAIGAGVGVAGAALLDRDPVSGGLIGGLVGAGVGAVTDRNDIDLGDSIFSGY